MSTTSTSIESITHPAADLLRDARGGPYATAYLPLASAVEDATDRHEAAVSAMVREFEALDVPEPVIDRARSAAARVDHADGGQVVIVADDQRAWTWPVAAARETTRTYWTSLPRVAPLLSMHQAVTPHLLVVADRAGADLDLVDGSVELDSTVSGDTEHIHRGKPGGWSQRRLQQRAENTWEQNARLVADEVTEIFDEHAPPVVVVTGDERAVSFILEHLPSRVAEATIRLEHGGRAAGADLDHMRTEIAAELAAIDADDVGKILEQFRSALANETAVDGIAETMMALFEGLASTLLVRVDADDTREAFHGERADEVAARRETLDSISIDATSGPVVEVALRAAFSTGCSVLFLGGEPGSPDAGIGAILRGDRAPLVG